MPVDTRLVDEDVVYCAPEDVFAHIRNKKYQDLPETVSAASKGALTQDQVDKIIANKSEKVDSETKRAWRTRKVVDAELKIKLSHKQKHTRHRRRRIRGGRNNRQNFQVDQRGFVDLPHTHIKPITSTEGDKVEVLNPRSVNDITEDEGRADGHYVVSNRKGILRPDIQLLTPVGTQTHGPTLEDGMAEVRVSYRYGYPHDVTEYDSDGDGVSDYVPGDISDATALLAAAQIVGSDQFGEMVPSGGENTPSLSDAASSWESSAKDTIREYKRV